MKSYTSTDKSYTVTFPFSLTKSLGFVYNCKSDHNHFLIPIMLSIRHAHYGFFLLLLSIFGLWFEVLIQIYTFAKLMKLQIYNLEQTEVDMLKGHGACTMGWSSHPELEGGCLELIFGYFLLVFAILLVCC